MVIDRLIQSAVRDLCSIVEENSATIGGALVASADRLAARLDTTSGDAFELTEHEVSFLIDLMERIAREVIRFRPPLRFNMLAMRVCERVAVSLAAVGEPTGP